MPSNECHSWTNKEPWCHSGTLYLFVQGATILKLIFYKHFIEITGRNKANAGLLSSDEKEKLYSKLTLFQMTACLSD